MKFSKTSALLFVMGIMLMAWTASQAAADIQTAAGINRGLNQPRTADLIAIQEEVESGVLPATPTPVATLADPAESVRATQIAATQASENAFLDAPVEPTPAGTVEPTLDPNAVLIPDRIIIPVIGLDAPVVEAQQSIVKTWGKEYVQWLAPDEFAAGWHPTSATLGQVGNMVFNGHHNVYGEVFGRLVDLESGDIIIVYSGIYSRKYQVANRMILPEKYETFNTRLENARWLQPTDDERLTLVTCWPKETNTHRLIIVAKPIE